MYTHLAESSEDPNRKADGQSTIDAGLISLGRARKRFAACSQITQTGVAIALRPGKEISGGLAERPVSLQI